jgi:hypothetical protein
MALENWLISLAEDESSHNVLMWAFDYILRRSNSVMPTAVLASLATGFPSILGKAALPLLKTPTLYGLDMERTVSERGGNELNWFASMLNRDPFEKLYTAERRTAATRPWRNEHLETLLTKLQFTNVREQAFAVIDELRQEAPKTKNWRFRFHRIDSRGWKAVEDRENNRILFEPQGLEPDLEKIQQESQEAMALRDRFSRMYLWTGKIFDRETPDREYYASWKDALDEANQLSEALKSGALANLARMYVVGVVKAATILLRDHSHELAEDDAAWCAATVIGVVQSTADSNDIFSASNKTDLDGAAAAASVLPILLDLTESEDDKLFVKELIATALTHVNANARAAAAEGIRQHLWKRDAQFAQKCIFGAIDYARLKVENSQRSRRTDFFPLDDEDGGDEEHTDAEVNAWLGGFRNRLAKDGISLSTADIERLSFETHSPWYVLTPCLMIPDGSTDSIHVALFSRMLSLFFAVEESVRKHGRDDRIENDIWINAEPRLNFTKRFAEYLVSLGSAGFGIR